MALAVAAPVVPDNWRVLAPRTKTIMGRALGEVQSGGTSISITDADIGNPGALLFAEAMSPLSGLRTVNLGGNRIGDEGAVALADVLHKHPNLQVLTLAYNRIGDLGAMHLARALEKHPGLRLLSLEGNCISDSGASQLMGALSINARGAEITCSLMNNPVKRLKSQAMENLAKSAVTVKSLAERGVTLGQLLKMYAAGLADGTIDPETTTTGDIVQDIVIPQSAPKRQSWVECFGTGNARPVVHCIHAWGGLFRDLVRAVASHVTGEAHPSLDLADPLWFFDAFGYKDRSYFIDAFCVNQHASQNSLRHYGLSDDVAYSIGSSGCQIDKFHLIAEQIQRRGGKRMVVVDVDNLVLGRVLCLREVHQAIGGGSSSDMVFCRLPGYPYDKMFTPVEDAQASCDADKDDILEDIRNGPGGYEQFNREIIEFVTSRIGAKYQEKINTFMPKEYE